MCFSVFVVFEVQQNFPAPKVIYDQYKDEKEFGMKPPAGEAVSQP